MKETLISPKRVLFAAGVLTYVLTFLVRLPWGWEFLLYMAAYLLLGGEIIAVSVKGILKGQIFNENFLMTIATVGAMAIGEYAEGVAVMLFYQIGEFFQEMALERSRKSISRLMDIRPDYANLSAGGGVSRVSPAEVAEGDLIIVNPGERVPLDGKIIKGSSNLDMSALTGELLPKEVFPGDEVLSGSVNLEGMLTVQVTKTFALSTVSKILEMAENAASKKAPAEKFITRFAKWYTPAVVFTAIAIAVLPPLFIQAVRSGFLPVDWYRFLSGGVGMPDASAAMFSSWIYRSLIFLVVSCPCALVISVPLGIFGGIGLASKNGILIKGGNYLEALNHVNTVVFDKTGTLTKGVFDVVEINPAAGFDKEELLRMAAAAENHSGHPIARSIVRAGGESTDFGKEEDFREISGYGVKIKLDGKLIIAGSHAFMEKEHIQAGTVETEGSVVHVAVDGIYAGSITVSDVIREDSGETVKKLKSMDIRTVMLTGDRRQNAENTGSRLGIDEIFPELLPDRKVDMLEKIKSRNPDNKVVFIGDGVNDAPVLASADIGIAMGGLGSDAAVESADVVFMTDEPSKILPAIRIARKTRRVVWENIIFAFSVKILVLALSTGGLYSMWEAVFADVGVALLAILNAMRLIHMKITD